MEDVLTQITELGEKLRLAGVPIQKALDAVNRAYASPHRHTAGGKPLETDG